MRYISAAAFFTFVLLKAAASCAGEVTDMEGHKVDVPATVTRLYGATPSDELLIYAIDPKLLAARAVSFKQEGLRYTDAELQRKPILGRFINGTLSNIEAVTQLKPDAVLLWNEALNAPGNENFGPTLKAANIPVIVTHYRAYDDIVAGLLMVGKLSGEIDRAQTLVKYATDSRREITDMVNRLGANEKLKVYFSENDEGFLSRCDDSLHVAPIKYAGGHIVPECKTGNVYVSADTNMEELLSYDPDVIITISSVFAQKTIAGQQWQQLKAVRNKRVYVIPNLPFNWFTRPPSFMQILGTKWMASILYPEHYKVDMVKETKDFYRLFLRRELTDREAQDILNGS